MKAIQLWAIDRNDPTIIKATLVDGVDNTETEAILEDILTRTPSLLADNLSLIGRQVPTEGGPLDLLGVDEDGRLVVFELKRGTLTRDAVAQVLDYVSDLAEMDSERLCKLVEDCSGRLGIEKIDDFEDWYGERFPDSDGPTTLTPRAILVGLGVDDRARRIVNYLANTGVDIQLLTFHAFMNSGQLLFARQVETVSPIVRLSSNRSTASSKAANLQILRDHANSVGVSDFFEEVTQFLEEALPAYAWPGKTSFTYYLTERTEQGKPTQRAYVSLYLNPKVKKTLTLVFIPRAVQVGKAEIEKFGEKFSDIVTKNVKSGQIDVRITPDSWGSISKDIFEVLKAVVNGWKTKSVNPLVETLHSKEELQAVSTVESN
ncbi:MAG: endonuclease NucS domain-containing protein [Thermodesulfobacteriota bacterium]